MIETYNLCKRYGDIAAVDNLTLSVKKGEIFGFLGPNGAGKTTTVCMLTTLLKPTSGTATICGADIIKESQKVRENIAVVSQRVRLDYDLTVRENLQFYAGIYRVQYPERITDISQDFDLLPLMDRKVSTLSGGLMRKVEIARCFLSHPQVLFLDEPTAGLDPKARKQFLGKVRSLVKERGITVFITTHILTEAETLCDRIGLLDKGEIVLIDTVESLLTRITPTIIEVNLTAPCPSLKENYNDAIFFEYEGNYLIENHDLFDEIREFCLSRRIKINSMILRNSNLEDIFIKYTGRRL